MYSILFSLGSTKEITLHCELLLTLSCSFLSTYIENTVFGIALRYTVLQQGVRTKDDVVVQVDVGKEGWGGARVRPSTVLASSVRPFCH